MDASAISDASPTRSVAPLPVNDPQTDPDSPYRRRNLSEDGETGNDDGPAPTMSKEELEEQIRALVMSPAGTSLMDILTRPEDSPERGTSHTKDFFGSTDRMYGKGKVTIQEQITEAENEITLIDLPPALSVLYAAAFSSQGKTSVVNLMAMLSGIAYVREQANYKEVSAQYRQDNDACYRLHVRSKESADRIAALREKLAKEREAAEMAECTFSPNPKIWANDEAKRQTLIKSMKEGKGPRKGHAHNTGKSAVAEVHGETKEGEMEDANAKGTKEGDEEHEDEASSPKRSVTDFVAHCYEWAKGRDKKLAAKVEKYNTEFDDSIQETRVPLTKRTQFLAERRRAKQQKAAEAMAMLSKYDNKRAAFASAVTAVNRSGRAHQESDEQEGSRHQDDAATKVRSLLDTGDQQSPTCHVRAVTCRRSILDEISDQHLYPSFEPITNSISQREDMFFKYLQYEAQKGGQEGSGSDEEEEEGEAAGDNHEGGDRAGDNDDQRSKSKDAPSRRKKKQQDGGEEFHYDPTVIEDALWAGKTDTAKTVQRLLDDVEQRKVRHAKRLEDDKLRQREQMYDPQTGQPLFQPNSMPTILYQKKRIPIDELPPSDRAEALKILRQKHLDFLHETAKKKKGRNGQRDLADFFQHCSELQSKAQKRVEKIRKLEEKELTGLFVPKVDEQSSKLIEARGREMVHKRELPVKEKPPSPPKKKESDGDRIMSMIERSKTWEQRRSTRLSRKEKEIEKEESKECTFSPKMQKAKNDRLAAASESRLASEMAVMRSQSEQIAQMAASLAQHHSLSRGGGGGSQRSSVSRHSGSYPVVPTSFARPRNNVVESASRSPQTMRGASEVFQPLEDDGPGPTLEQLSRDDGYPSSPHRGGQQAGGHVAPLSPSGGARRVTSSAAQSHGSVDNLINSWNELDNLTDAVLSKLERDQH